MPETTGFSVAAFRGRRIVVVGDVVLDRYWWGTVNRISPEAPVPIVNVQTKTNLPGGAANVAVNVASLGGVPAVIGVVGRDQEADELRAALAERDVRSDFLVEAERPTTAKTRIIAHSQQLARIDEEDSRAVDEAVEKVIIDRAVEAMSAAAVVVVSDYAKGTLTPFVLQRVIQEAGMRGIPVLVDPKGHEYSRYDGATLLSPNRMEALIAASLPYDRPDLLLEAGHKLLAALKVENLLITEGEAGMRLFRRGEPVAQIHSVARKVYDVTGAGDTVIATCALAIAAGCSTLQAARIANVAAGLAVEQVGTVAVSICALELALKTIENEAIAPSESDLTPHAAGDL